MFWLKSCPHCDGDLLAQDDRFGSFVTCVQCGFSKDLPSVTEGPFVVTADSVPAPLHVDSEGVERNRVPYNGRHPNDTSRRARQKVA